MGMTRTDEWMKTIILVAKGNEYSGEDVGDYSECAQLVFIDKFKVDEDMKMSNVPAEHHGKESPERED